MKRAIAIILVLVLVFSALPSGVAAEASGSLWPEGYSQNPLFSTWATESMAQAYMLGIYRKSTLPEISRIDFCYSVVRTYEALNPTEKIKIKSYDVFSDTRDEHVLKAYTLGIVGGFPDGTFMPYENIKRQDLAKMIYNLLTCLSPNIKFSDIEADAAISKFVDGGTIAGYAKTPVGYLASNSIIRGNDLSEFTPNGTCTGEQALAMLVRCYSMFKPLPDVESGGYSRLAAPKITTENDQRLRSSRATEYVLSWEPVEGAVSYRVYHVYDNLISAYSEVEVTETEILPFDYSTTGNLSLIVIPVDQKGKPSIHYGQVKVKFLSYKDIIYGENGEFSYATEAEAKKNMKDVKINVWKIDKSGKKYASTIWVTVNKNLAGEVYEIFQKIFESPEQFPIKEVGGFRYGSGKSEHSVGSSVDINSNENYCVYANGKVVGSHWKPGEDPYSMPEDGIVVKTFYDYGWFWGGVGWNSGTVDYMHFSLGGT